MSKLDIHYAVTEVFLSLQGEGLNTGRSAWFIRLAGCNLACPGCDDPLHDDKDKSKLKSVSEIMAMLDKPSEIIVITGGEPTLYDLQPLVDGINNLPWVNEIHKTHPSKGPVASKGFMKWFGEVANGPLICIETNGTKHVRGQVDFVCVSPKPASFGKVMEKSELCEKTVIEADEIKFVLGWDDEVSILSLMKKLYFESSAQLFVSPLTQFPGNTLIQETADRAVEFVKKHAALGVRLSLQTHKWINVR